MGICLGWTNEWGLDLIDTACKDCDLSRYESLFWNKVPEADVTWWKPFNDFLCFHRRVPILPHSFSGASIIWSCHLSYLIPPMSESCTCWLTTLNSSEAAMCIGVSFLSGLLPVPSVCNSILWPAFCSNSSFRPHLLWCLFNRPPEFPEVDCASLPMWSTYHIPDFITASATVYKNCLLTFLFCPLDHKTLEDGDVSCRQS